LWPTPGAGAAYLYGPDRGYRGNAWNAQKGQLLALRSASPGARVAFGSKLVFRGGYGLNYNQEEIALSARASANNPWAVQSNPTYVAAVHTPTSRESRALSTPCRRVCTTFTAIRQTRTFNFSLWPEWPAHGLSVLAAYQARGRSTSSPAPCRPCAFTTTRSICNTTWATSLVASLGYQGSLSRDIEFHENPLAYPGGPWLRI
jgi:hypothetical protein